MCQQTPQDSCALEYKKRDGLVCLKNILWKTRVSKKGYGRHSGILELKNAGNPQKKNTLIFRIHIYNRPLMFSNERLSSTGFYQSSLF